MTAYAPARSLAEQFAPAPSRGGAAWASLGTTARGGALALSVFAHVAVVAVGLHENSAALHAPLAPARAALVELQAPELEPSPPEAAPETPAPAVEATPARAVTEHAPPSAARRAPPASVASPSVASPSVASPSVPSPSVASPEPLVTAAERAPRFVMPAGAVQATQAASIANPQPSQAGGALETAAAPLPEREVDVAARLIAGTPPAYTASAEAAGVEASVPVELVIDGTGAVTSAVVLAHVGYGLDEAALSAVRRYRFAPARRGGKVVAVRMHWVVVFELG